MKIIQYSLGQLQANCYVLINDNLCLLIDPADESSFILEELQRKKLQLIGMFATHGHFDHIMAVGEIQKSLNIPLYMMEKDMFLVKRLKESAHHWLGYDPYLIEPTDIRFLKKGLLEIKNWKLKVIETPGHTPGSCCYYFEKEKIIFTGDTLFKQGIGRYDFSYSSKKDLDNSLKRIFHLPGNIIIYPGHGEETIIDTEKLTCTFD